MPGPHLTSRTVCGYKIYPRGLCSKAAEGRERPQGKRVQLTANAAGPRGHDQCSPGGGGPTTTAPPAQGGASDAAPAAGFSLGQSPLPTGPTEVTCPMGDAGHRAQPHPLEGQVCWAFASEMENPAVGFRFPRLNPCAHGGSPTLQEEARNRVSRAPWGDTPRPFILPSQVWPLSASAFQDGRHLGRGKHLSPSVLFAEEGPGVRRLYKEAVQAGPPPPKCPAGVGECRMRASAPRF